MKPITGELDDILISTWDIEMYDYPTNQEAQEAFNTLIWWCVSMWTPGGDYSGEQLCE